VLKRLTEQFALTNKVGLGFALPTQKVEPLMDKSGQVYQVAGQETVLV
jgi:hypothetical protein